MALSNGLAEEARIPCAVGVPLPGVNVRVVSVSRTDHRFVSYVGVGSACVSGYRYVQISVCSLRRALRPQIRLRQCGRLFVVFAGDGWPSDVLCRQRGGGGEGPRRLQGGRGRRVARARARRVRRHPLQLYMCMYIYQPILRSIGTRHISSSGTDSPHRV